MHRELMNIIKITNEYNQDTQFLISFHQHGELLSMLIDAHLRIICIVLTLIQVIWYVVMYTLYEYT